MRKFILLFKLLVIIVAFLLLNINSIALDTKSKELQDSYKKVTPSYKISYKQGIEFYHIYGSSDYNYGYNEGLALKIKYKCLISFAKAFFKNKLEYNKPIALNHIKTLEKSYPSFLQRIKGKSDALNINLQELVNIDMLYLSMLLKDGGCTDTAVSSAASKNNQSYLSWNVDTKYWYKIFFSRYFRPPPVVICDIEGKNKYVKLSILSSIFGFGLVNEHGLSYVATAVFSNETAEGLSSLELNNIAMETCSTIDEVANLYRSSNRSSGMIDLQNLYGLTSNLNTLWSDMSGEVMLIEYNHSNIFIKKDVLLAETNHYQFLGNKNEGDLDSNLRLNRAYELLEKYNGSIDIKFFKNVLTCDHGGGLKKDKPDNHDICKHNFKQRFGTICSIIIVPKKLVGYYCPGNPCMVRFRYLDFSEVLVN